MPREHLCKESNSANECSGGVVLGPGASRQLLTTNAVQIARISGPHGRVLNSGNHELA